MTSDIPHGSNVEMAKREALAHEFFAATRPELIPFVSYEAKWFHFDYVETDQLSRVIKAHYRLELDEASLRLPFWQFLDYLQASRAH
jgi:hypothetical protein